MPVFFVTKTELFPGIETKYLNKMHINLDFVGSINSWDFAIGYEDCAHNSNLLCKYLCNSVQIMRYEVDRAAGPVVSSKDIPKCVRNSI